MKILFTGGGSGGHFYPVIAVAEAVNTLVKNGKLLPPDLYYMSDRPFDERLLFDNNITFKKVSTGKMRRYFSIKNIFDVFKTALAILRSLIKVFEIYPDVVFGKGGYASFPALFAAKFFKIPIVIHESDSVPGKVNLWAAKFAKYIAVSYPEAASYFPKEKVAWTGNPLRKEILGINPVGAYEFLKLQQSIPVLLILGGSLGSDIINQNVLDILPELVSRYQVIHQTGRENFATVSITAEVILSKSSNKERYKPFDYIDDLGLKMSASVASLVISRAGSTIFEIAAWGLPSLIIPITDSNGDHQRKNAFNYARSGGAVVIEEINLSPHILLSEIDQLFAEPARMEAMRNGAKSFARIDAADKIAGKLLEIALGHEK